MIYLLRHGETLWNSERRFQGRRDSPLTTRGIEQARALGRLLAAELADPGAFSLLASPQGRAWQSAVLVAAGLGRDPLEIVLEPRLMEQAYGRWEGRQLEEIAASDRDLWQSYRADRWRRSPPEGESYGDVARRVGGWLGEIAEADRLIVVCHGVVSRVLRGLYADLPRQAMMDLPEPQSSLYRLADGRIEQLDAAAAG